MMRAVQAGADRTEGTNWLVAIAATLGMSVSYIDRQTLAAIAPAVRTALQIDHRLFGWLLSAFSMAYLVGAPTAGIVVDKLGARRGFAIAVLVWTIVAASHALVTSFAMLFVLRIVLGAAEAPSFPAAAQAIRRALPNRTRSAAYGLLFTGSSIGATIAGPLAVVLQARFHVRVVFVLVAIAGMAWLPLWLFATRGDALLVPAGPSAPPRAESPSIYRGPGSYVQPPSRWLAVATSAPVLRAIVAVVGSAPAIMFVLNWTSLYLVDRWHLPKDAIGGYLVFPPIVFDLGAVGFGVLASRLERTNAMRSHSELMLGAGALGATLALTPLVSSPAAGVAVFSVAVAGCGGIYVLCTADMMKRVPVDRTSAAGGLTAAAQSLSHIVAAPLAGWAIDRTHGFGAALVGLGLLTLPTTIAWVLWPGLSSDGERA